MYLFYIFHKLYIYIVKIYKITNLTLWSAYTYIFIILIFCHFISIYAPSTLIYFISFTKRTSFMANFTSPSFVFIPISFRFTIRYTRIIQQKICWYTFCTMKSRIRTETIFTWTNTIDTVTT